MSNPNSQLDGLGSFNQSAQNAGTIKYGAFNNASRNLGTIALSAVFGNTSINQGTIGDVLPIVTASIVQQNSANWDAAYTTVLANSAMWALSGGSGGGGTGDATNAPIWDAVAAYVQAMSSTFVLSGNGDTVHWDAVYSNVMSNSAAWMSSDTTNAPAWNAAASFVQSNSASLVYTNDSRLAKATTAYSYLTGTSASFVTTSVLNSSIAGKVDSSTLSGYATTASVTQSISGKADSSALSGYVLTSDSRLSQASNVYTQVQSNSAGWAAGSSGSINYTIDGGGIAITTGSKGFVQVPSNFVVQEWDIIADLQTTSFIVDVRKASYANLPTTTSIVGADYMTLSNQQKNRNMSVSWTNISAGDFVEFYVTDASNASMINISLKGIRS